MSTNLEFDDKNSVNRKHSPSAALAFGTWCVGLDTFAFETFGTRINQMHEVQRTVTFTLGVGFEASLVSRQSALSAFWCKCTNVVAIPNFVVVGKEVLSFPASRRFAAFSFCFRNWIKLEGRIPQAGEDENVESRDSSTMVTNHWARGWKKSNSYYKFDEMNPKIEAVANLFLNTWTFCLLC